jgi:hypothetical protein
MFSTHWSTRNLFELDAKTGYEVIIFCLKVSISIIMLVGTSFEQKFLALLLLEAHVSANSVEIYFSIFGNISSTEILV